MGALIATIFTVVVVAISSIVITNPNINFDNRSKASSCKPCEENQKAIGKDSSGCYICENIDSSSKPTNNTSTVSSTSCSGPDSAAACKNKSVGDTFCAHNTIRCTRTKDENCSAVDTGVQCEGFSNTPNPTNSVSPTSSISSNNSNTSPCNCIGGHLQGSCGASTGAACSANMTPTPTLTPDSCGGGMVCSSKSSTSCINGGGEPTSCVRSGGASGNCCSSTSAPVVVPTNTQTNSLINSITPSISISPTNTSPSTSPTSCKKINESPTTTSPCCSPLVKVVTPYGTYCGNKGECTPGEKKCQVGANNTYFEYLCDSSGYFQQNKRCDFGCTNNSCSTGGCVVGQTRCDPSRPNELETCTGTVWNGKSCENGCETISGTRAQCKTISSCTNPTGTPGVTKICNDAGGYNYCSSDGNWYSRKCEAEIKGSVCISGKCVLPNPTTSASAQMGNTGIDTPTEKTIGIGDKCDDNAPCSTGYCYAGNQVLGGSPFDSAKTCHINPIEVMDETQKDLATNTAIGMTAITGAAVVGTVALPAYTYGMAALSTAPVAVQTGLGVAGTIAGWVGVGAGTAACVSDPGSDICLAYVAGLQGDPTQLVQLAGATDDIFNSFAVSRQINNTIRASSNTSSTNNIVNSLANGEEKLTLYHGSQGDLESILNNGIYGVSDGGPTLSNQMMEAPLEFASGKGLSIMQSSPTKKLGGYILEVEVPQSNVVVTDLIDNESYYALSANNRLQPKATYENQVTLSPNFIKNIYPVNDKGVVASAIPEAEWASYATQFNVARNIAAEERFYLRLKKLFPNESEEFIQNFIQNYK